MRTYYIFIVMGLLIAINACDLTTEPIVDKLVGNYYSTPDEANEALTGCYDALQLIWSDGVAFPLAADVMSDLCFGGTGASDGEGFPMLDQFDLSVSPADLNVFEPNWKNYYKGIFRCNTLLQKIGNVNWDGQDELAKQIEA
ncbi:MAG TPA: RagB/SusD family nutrient uptake outer membrane protein, partial [Marinilabiliales bacterium]|nr:RagB/SusD family nutrient uptake outer membrane protein [Marinilabiliales bacterium]